MVYLGVVALVSACGGSASTPTTSATPSSEVASPGASATPVESPIPVESASPSSTASPASSPIASPSSPASPTSSPSPASSPSPSGSGLGAISGQLNFPSEFLPAQLVYAINVEGVGAGVEAIETVNNQGHYTIEGVPAGQYHVYSVRRPASKDDNGNYFVAAWSAFVPCGLDVSCPSHKELVVNVKAGSVSAGVNVYDWYAPSGTFVGPPAQILSNDPSIVNRLANYSNAYDAALGVARSSESAILVENMEGCPLNLACMQIGVEKVGTSAAYFVGIDGSNTDHLACNIYVYKTSVGWSGLRRDCREGVAFPGIGASGYVSLGIGNGNQCANVRSVPKGSVVGCIKDGTKVVVDAGPTYAPFSGMDGMWWHVKGKGWMADDFLR